MTTERLTDPEGHHWPVTGHWCDACGMPLTPYIEDQTVHPNCEDES